MASGKHIGKVLIEVDKVAEEDTEEDDTKEGTKKDEPNKVETKTDEPNKVETKTTQSKKYKSTKGLPYECRARFFCNPDHTYVVVGGLGGFGLELADWLVIRGAKKIVLSSRKGIVSGYQQHRIDIFKSYGANVVVSAHNVFEENEVSEMLKEAEALGPVNTIFQLAVVLKDAIFENQNAESFKLASDPKATATINLDKCSRKLCPKLENFVVFSSVSCGRGNPGQTNYAFSNSIMERLCEVRKADGLPALAIQWGAIGQVGLVVEMQDGLERAISGTLQQNLTSCFNALEGFLFSSSTVVSSIVLDEKRGMDSDDIVQIVANIMGIKNVDAVAPNSTLIELGMDSIMAVEIKQAVERNMEVNLTADHLRGLTFGKLKELAQKQKQGGDASSISITDDTTDQSSKTDYLIHWSGFTADDGLPILKCKESSDKSPSNQVFVFPAIEGNALGVKPLTDNMESNVYCLQYSNDLVDQSYRGIAERALPHVIELLGTSKTFNLVGYSYGGTICLMIAHALERLGLKGKICMVDSSPFMLKTWSDMFLNTNNTNNAEKTQSIIITKFIEGVYGADAEEIKKVIAETDKIIGWEQKVDFITEYFTSNKTLGMAVGKEFVKSKIMAANERVKGVGSLETIPDKQLESPCILIKSTKVYVPGPEDYGLSKLLKLPVKTYAVEGSHVTMLQEPQTSYLINSFFGFKVKAPQSSEK